MRLSRAIKLVTLVGLVSTLVSISLWASCSKSEQNDETKDDESDVANFVRSEYHKRGTNSIGTENDGLRVISEDSYQEISCNINGETTVACRKEGNEVYMPFSFVKNYFEVYGGIDKTEGIETFMFHHTNGIVHPPRPTYSPSSIFMAFDHYNVENRERVKCVTASEGVPITTQWSKDGYHYPTQVAQYGLSHHAKRIVEGEPDQLVLEDAEEEQPSDWQLADKKSQVRIVTSDTAKDNHILEFLTSDSLQSKGVVIGANEKSNKCFILDVKFATNGSVTVTVETYNKLQIKIHYVFTTKDIAYDGRSNIYYGLGERHHNWIHLARDLKFDLLKGLLIKLKIEKLKVGYGVVRIVDIRIHGHGWLDNLTLSSSVHMHQFFDAANWLVKHQDSRGGWPIMVQRRMVTGVLELAPGWYSAMGQGQAISTLVRAYIESKDKKYLTSAANALKLFEVDSKQGGVRAKFLGYLDWYEEYPTIPSSFVLNGFIYSLMGLYDLKETAKGKDGEYAERIFNSGMKSLKLMLGMYDSGVGTFYDLRHLTTSIEPNRARWDYHATHINQLLQLIVIDDDPIFKTTVQRWLGYLKGKKSRHN